MAINPLSEEILKKYSKALLESSKKSGGFMERIIKTEPSSGVIYTGPKSPEGEIDGLLVSEYGISPLRQKCMKMLLICLPSGYGFIPILGEDIINSYGIELAFGKLGKDKMVQVFMHPKDGDILFNIQDGNTYSSSEIRLMVFAIVDKINELNGIDDGEQDKKGPE